MSKREACQLIQVGSVFLLYTICVNNWNRTVQEQVVDVDAKLEPFDLPIVVIYGRKKNSFKVDLTDEMKKEKLSYLFMGD